MLIGRILNDLLKGAFGSCSVQTSYSAYNSCQIMLKLVILLPTVLLFVSRSHAIKCYECIGCRSELQYTPQKSDCQACGKTTIYKNSNLKEVSRRCYPSCQESKSTHNGIITEEKCCYTDLCNSGNNVGVQHLLLCSIATLLVGSLVNF
ncbi:hypothetical protein SprV_0200778700 [Sparganum proliferum]